jgi:hypothetical protein
MLFAGASQGSVRGAAPARHTQRSLSWIYRAPRQYVGSNMLRGTKAWPLARFQAPLANYVWRLAYYNMLNYKYDSSLL